MIHTDTLEQRLEIIEKVLDGIREGLPEYQAAKNAGISFPTWFRWRKETPGLELRQSQAKQYRIPLIVDALYKAALKGSVMACLAILEKEDPDWHRNARDLSGAAAMEKLAGTTAAALIASMSPEKRQKVLTIISSMKQIGAPPSDGTPEPGA